MSDTHEVVYEQGHVGDSGSAETKRIIEAHPRLAGANIIAGGALNALAFYESRGVTVSIVLSLVWLGLSVWLGLTRVRIKRRQF